MRVQQVRTEKVPAGIFSGIEAFWHENEKWVIAHGTVKRFHECDSTIQQPIWKAFMADKQSLAYITKIGITKASETFDRWYRCVVGGLDHVPDFDLKFTPDAYNNMCADMQCPHRGRLCGCKSGLKNIEVETLSALKSARNMEQAASDVHVSLQGFKSRIAKLHEKFEVPTTIALMSVTSQLGV